MYKFTSENRIIRIADEALIPVDEGNRDYLTYLAWIAEGNQPAQVAPMTQDELKAQVKATRAAALEKFPKNSGVSTVYELNFQAATLGDGDTTTILRNGKTPAQHLYDFGVHLGMTSAQFAAYVLAENLAAGQKMSEIEAQYLAIYYDGPMTEQTVIDYQAYCDVRTAGY